MLSAHGGRSQGLFSSQKQQDHRMAWLWSVPFLPEDVSEVRSLPSCAVGLDGTVKNYTLVPLSFYITPCVFLRSFLAVSWSLIRELRTLKMQLTLLPSQDCLALREGQPKIKELFKNKIKTHLVVWFKLSATTICQVPVFFEQNHILISISAFPYLIWHIQESMFCFWGGG